MKKVNSLKKTLAAFAMALCAGLTANAQAGDTDACTVTLCMFGKLTGNSGGSECKSAEKNSLAFKSRSAASSDRDLLLTLARSF